MQMQRQMRLYPEVSLEPGQLPLMELAALSDRESLSHIAVALSPDAASRIGTRGPLAAALRGAIAGESDRNADGLLGSAEVAEHVRDAIGRRAYESGLTSSDFQMSTRIDLDWALAAAGSSDARARRERYLATLREWRDRNWISVATELAARSVLDEWVRSREERISIDPKTQELWDILQRHLEGSGNDIDRARSLEAHIRKRY
jgi:hypothetical protein